MKKTWIVGLEFLKDLTIRTFVTFPSIDVDDVTNCNEIWMKFAMAETVEKI